MNSIVSSDAMEFVLLKPNGSLLEAAWKWLESHPINEGIQDPSIALNEGYAWEYRGTYRQDNKAVTEFLHRKHVNTNSLVKLSYGHDITDEDIEKKYKV